MFLQHGLLWNIQKKGLTGQLNVSLKDLFSELWTNHIYQRHSWNNYRMNNRRFVALWKHDKMLSAVSDIFVLLSFTDALHNKVFSWCNSVV